MSETPLHDRPLQRKRDILNEVLDQLDGKESSEGHANLRKDERYNYRNSAVVLELQQPDGSWIRYASAARNISSAGVALLVGKFIYPGTHCHVHLVSLQNLQQTVKGKVARCRYLKGTICLHELGIQFEQPVAIGMFHRYAAQTRILLIDDDVSIHRLVTHLLKPRNAKITSAYNGETALQKAQEEEFDLVLTDFELPDINGLDVARQLREQAFVRPIVAVTAMTDDQTRESCLKAGCTSFIPKPLTKAILLDLIDSYGPEHLVSEFIHDAEMRPLIDQFVAELPEKICQLQEAIRKQDVEGLARLARMLKAGGTSYGFELVTITAAALEQVATAGQDIEVIRGQVNELVRWCLGASPASFTASD